MFRVRCSGDENKAWISEENHKTVCHSIGESPKSLFDTFGKNEVRYCELLCKANKDVTQTRAHAHKSHHPCYSLLLLGFSYGSTTISMKIKRKSEKASSA